MDLHQTHFFPYELGNPSIQTLRTSPSKSLVAVTTDRNVAILRATRNEFRLDPVHFLEKNCPVEVVTSTVLESPGRESIAVVYTELTTTSPTAQSTVAVAEHEGKMFLSIVQLTNVINNVEESSSTNIIRFELVNAPSTMLSVRASTLNVGSCSIFHGVILFQASSMFAFGYIDENRNTVSTECVRLSDEQFALFFPELSSFSHPVLSIDVYINPLGMDGWIALGCSDGYLCVFRGSTYENSVSGPFEKQELHMDGPVTAISLYGMMRGHEVICNLVSVCAIGAAVLYEDVVSRLRPIKRPLSILLPESDTYDTIFSTVAADVDMDGETELLIGTDNQVVLVYKLLETDKETDKSWTRLTSDEWDIRVFGAIYSMAWLDLNRDGVNELIIASSTGVYIYQFDPQMVVNRVESFLSCISKCKS